MTDDELRESAYKKIAAAKSDIATVLLGLTEDEYQSLMGFKFVYTLTYDEFRAMFGETGAKPV